MKAEDPWGWIRIANDPKIKRTVWGDYYGKWRIFIATRHSSREFYVLEFWLVQKNSGYPSWSKKAQRSKGWPPLPKCSPSTGQVHWHLQHLVRSHFRQCPCGFAHLLERTDTFCVARFEAVFVRWSGGQHAPTWGRSPWLPCPKLGRREWALVEGTSLLILKEVRVGGAFSEMPIARGNRNPSL